MASVDNVDSLAKFYEHGKKKDYITNPKSDGYRSIHVIHKYQSPVERRQVYNGLRIEIQLRSKLQHAWATAVETVSTFTSQSLKTNAGSDSWKRFFALMGSAIALKEGCPIVPGTPSDPNELAKELRILSTGLDVINRLIGWKVAVSKLTEQVTDVHTYLLVLDSDKRNIQITPYRNDELSKATDEYLRIEKEIVHKYAIQAVLVSVESLATLKSAYPNYYADTSDFVLLLMEAVASREYEEGEFLQEP